MPSTPAKRPQKSTRKTPSKAAAKVAATATSNKTRAAKRSRKSDPVPKAIPAAKPTPRKRSSAKASQRTYRTAPIQLPAAALPHLRKSHPHMDRVIDSVGPCTLTVGHSEGPFVSLVRAIVFQQLATKAASTIFGRLRDLFPSDGVPDPVTLLGISDAALRGCGLSGQKLGYVRDLAARVDRGELDLDALESLSDEDVIKQLTTVRGIGRWSAQMFLIFYLGRLNVWPDGDLGIRHGVRILHGHSELPAPTLMQNMGERFSPYASVASWYLWRLLDIPEADRIVLLT